MFAPETMSKVELFSWFVGPPFTLDRHLTRGVATVKGQMRRVEVLRNLFNSILIRLPEDNDQLKREGFSPANYGRAAAAIGEAIILGHYSVLDGLRDTLFCAYHAVPGMQRKSTNQLFKRAHEKHYGSGFPETIRADLDAAYVDWFPPLRELRVELTHAGVGFCYLARDTGHVTYTHDGLGTPLRARSWDDFPNLLSLQSRNVTALAEKTFAYLFAQLAPMERRVPCGLSRGRIYERVVAPEPGLSIASGRCYSRSWFLSEPGFGCPMQGRCAAFDVTGP